MDDRATYEIATLEKLRIGLQQYLAAELIDPKVEFDWCVWADSIVCRVHGYVWAEQVERHEIKYPADWWQAFKARWFPRWARARWPVQYEVHVVDVKAIYPTFRPALPPEQYMFRLHIMDRGTSQEGRDWAANWRR